MTNKTRPKCPVDGVSMVPAWMPTPRSRTLRRTGTLYGCEEHGAVAQRVKGNVFRILDPLLDQKGHLQRTAVQSVSLVNAK